jgi:D-serine deaminase-like pyridoxal phosphate-dependent protein
MSVVAGCSKHDLDTPALCLDIDALQANIREAVQLCRDYHVAWRPHAKCHKSPDIARLILEAGAIGLTCAKLGEAEVFAAAGVSDLLIANILVGRQKIARLVELRRIADPIICLDHIDQAEPISLAMQAAGLTVRAMLEMDIGLERVGLLPGQDALRLAQRIAELPGLQLVGVMGYEGHLQMVDDPVDKRRRVQAALGQLVETKEQLLRAGLPCPIVSCGGTGTFELAVAEPGVTEVQAGGAIFMDAYYRHRCAVERFQFALTILTTVVSRPASDRAIIDAGRKTMNMEIHRPLVVGRSDIQVRRLSAEHGWLKLEPSAQNLQIGERLELIPGYGDLTTLLHDRFFACRGDRVEAIWPITARGRLQ